jgi:hypothetical protein
MVISIRLTPDDLVKMRFAYSPMLEVVTSYRVLTKPSLQSPYLRWVDEALQVLHDVELPYLHALATPHGYIPDFLSPTPITPQTDIEDELQRLLELPDEMIRRDIETLIATSGDSELRQHFLIYPRDALLCLIDELRLYWQRTLAHHWPRMMTILEGDVLYRARKLALEGVESLFSDLHSGLAYEAGTIRINKKNVPTCIYSSELRGNGIQLVPTVFSGAQLYWQIVPHWHPMLIYNVRGAGLWQGKPEDASQSLELALGTGRARVLYALTTPATTGELALRLEISAGGVSQHLSRLEQAGLAEAHRSGKRVYYQLTERGESLLSLFS